MQVDFPIDRRLDYYNGRAYRKACGIDANMAKSNQDEKPIIQLWQINGDKPSVCYLSIPIESVDAVIEMLRAVKGGQ